MVDIAAPLQVANFLLSESRERGELLTNLSFKSFYTTGKLGIWPCSAPRSSPRISKRGCTDRCYLANIAGFAIIVGSRLPKKSKRPGSPMNLAPIS